VHHLAPQRTFLLLLILLILLSTCPIALGAPLSCTYDPKTRGWTLQAQQIPLSVLLSALASRAGFELVGPLPSEPKISLQSQKAPLDEILKQILQQGQCRYGLVYREDRVRRLILLTTTPDTRSPASSQITSVAPSSMPSSQMPQPGNPDEQQAPEAAEATQLAEASNRDTQPEELLRWAGHKDPHRDRSAFKALAPLPGEGRLDHRLREALHDSDPAVRARARSILGHPTAGIPNPQPEQIPEEQSEE